MNFNNLTGGGRRRYMNSRKPYDAEIEYLESNKESGYVAIILDYIPTGRDLNIQLGFTLLGFPDTNNYYIFGSGSIAEGCCFSLERGVGRGNTFIIYYSSTSLANTVNIPSNVYHDIEFDPESKVLKLNGDAAATLPTPLNAPNTSPITLIGKADLVRYIYGRIYYMRITRKGVVELDLIPVRKGNKGFLYDKVSGKMYRNTGSGEFFLGPDKN